MTHKISKIPHLEALGLMIMVWVALLVVGVSALGVNIPTSLLSGNGSQINVNNSLYWQGHTGTDGSWLTGISMFNDSYVPYTGATQNVDISPYNLTTDK